MTTVTSTVEKPSPKMILVAALLVAVFASAVIDVVVPITTVDMARTFSVLPGTVGQLNSLNAIATVVTALLMGAFAFRFRYKSLVMTGVLFVAFCAAGLFLAPNFSLARLVFPLNGIGSVMIIVTAQTFIGNSYPMDRRAKAIGLVTAASTLANAVGSPIIGYMTNTAGWRSVLIGFMLPTSIVSLIFVLLIFPFNLPAPQLNTKKEPFMKGFKQVLTNKSAVACLVTAFLINGAVFGGAVFDVTFLRQVFSVSPFLASWIGPTAGTALITVGAVVGGRIVNRVGRKRLAVLALLLAGTLTLLSYFILNLWVRQALHWTAGAFGGVATAAFLNLMLEQVPRFRGTSMSLTHAFGGMGQAIGIVTAGAVLNLFLNPTTGFQAMGATMGAFILAAILVILFFARDPIKAQQLAQKSAFEPGSFENMAST